MKEYEASVRIFYSHKHNTCTSKPDFELLCHKKATIVQFLNDLNTVKHVSIGPLVIKSELVHHVEVKENE